MYKTLSFKWLKFCFYVVHEGADYEETVGQKGL